MITDRRVFLSREIAGPRETRVAAAAVLACAICFVALAPFATRQLPAVSAFIPAYEAALVVCDLITAVLLFGQFAYLRSRALLVLASGYLFTALIAGVHAISFPGAFSPTGLLGSGPGTTVWLYVFWHGGFPLFVICHALLKGEVPRAIGSGPGRLKLAGPRRAILLSVVALVAVVLGLTLLAMNAHHIMPVLIRENRFTPVLSVLLTACWTLSLLSLAVAWRRKPHTVLDLWLMVVMCVWVLEIALSAVLNAGRFDLGWYAGRVFGLLASCFLLVVLLAENAMHYARLTELSAKLESSVVLLGALSRQDGLTGLANRRYFDAYLAEQMALARRRKKVLALILCDVDAFKSYNDRHGHPAGDECLKRIAAALQSCCRRPTDMAARYGGEEFAMILPDTELRGALQIAAAMRAAVAGLRIEHDSPAGACISISGGVAVCVPNGESTAQQLIAAADRALYRAKREGRDQIAADQALAA